MRQAVLREEPGLTEFAFNRLLDWLDDGVESQGETYLEIRRRLVAYFDRRDRPFPDDLADETLNRVGRTLEESGSIAVKPPARFCYVIARFVLLEDLRRQRRIVHMDQTRVAAPADRGPTAADESSEDDQRLARLEHCLHNLKPEQRQLVLEYYRDEGREKIEHRRELAKRLGISMNALGIRACRIRSALQTCLHACSHLR